MTFLLVFSVLALMAFFVYRKVRSLRKRASSCRRGRIAALVLTVAVLLGQALVMSPAASAAECEGPAPERSGTGMVGAVDPTDGFHGSAGSPYIDYGYAGMVWYTYGPDSCGIGSAIVNANREMDTWVGNQTFNVAKLLVGTTNSLHYLMAEGSDGLLQPLTAAVSKGGKQIFDNVYGKLFGLVAVLLSIVMFVGIWRGDLSGVSKKGLYLVGAMWLASSSLVLVNYFGPIDKAVIEYSTNLQAGLLRDANQDANQVSRDVLPTELHTQVVYNNWLRGEFGDPADSFTVDNGQKVDLGRELLSYQAFTYGEMHDGTDADEKKIQEKRDNYKAFDSKLNGKPAQDYFRGTAGSRFGVGVLALGQSLCYALFQLTAKLAILLGLLLLRLFVLGAPIIGLVAMVYHDLLRKVLKVLGVVVFTIFTLTVLAGVDALILHTIFNSAGFNDNIFLQTVIAGLATVILFYIGRPITRLRQMIQTPVNEFGGSLSMGGGVFSRFRRNPSLEPTRQEAFWQEVKESDTPITVSQQRERPEARVIQAVAARLDRTSGATQQNRQGNPAIGSSRAQNGLPVGGSPQVVFPSGSGVGPQTVSAGARAASVRPGRQEEDAAPGSPKLLVASELTNLASQTLNAGENRISGYASSAGGAAKTHGADEAIFVASQQQNVPGANVQIAKARPLTKTDSPVPWNRDVRRSNDADHLMNGRSE